jgi:hypothetical protein
MTSADGTTVALTAASAGGAGGAYTVMITSAVDATTVTRNGADQPESTRSSVNLHVGNTGINGGSNGRSDYLFSGFGPADALILNQRGVDPVLASTSPRQRLAFVFLDPDGAVVAPIDVSLTVFDISSVNDANGSPTEARSRYWDAVGFSTTPRSITPSGRSTLYGGAGSGSLADPFHRAAGHAPSLAGSYLTETFEFATFPSGTTMEYTNREGRAGWQFISITGLEFTIAELCP